MTTAAPAPRMTSRKTKRGRVEHRQSADVCIGCWKAWPCPAVRFAMKKVDEVTVEVTVRVPLSALEPLKPSQRRALLDGLTAVMIAGGK